MRFLTYIDVPIHSNSNTYLQTVSVYSLASPMMLILSMAYYYHHHTPLLYSYNSIHLGYIFSQADKTLSSSHLT